MANLEHGGRDLANIHDNNNKNKYFCHFTGFLEGIAASGYIETNEVQPLIAECEEFIDRISDGDASDIVEDFRSDLLEYETIADAAKYRIENIDPACTKSALNRFLGFCRGLVCDGVIATAEARKVVLWLEESPHLLEVTGVRQIQISCFDAIEDDIVTPEESDEICEAIGEVVGDCYADTGMAQTGGVANVEEFRIGDIHADLEGRVIVLTGSFQTTPRSHFEDELSALGAIIARNVSQKTDYVIIGGEAARDWIEMNRGTKIRKAQEIRKSRETPRFISESHLLTLMRGRP